MLFVFLVVFIIYSFIFVFIIHQLAGTGNTNDLTTIKSIGSVTGDSVGAAVGAAIGSITANPIGLVLGASAGGLVGSLINTVSDDYSSRVLSQKEKERVSDVLALATKEIDANLDKGLVAREDFFCEDSSSAVADELLEGTLKKAQEEYENKKIPFLAKLYANLVFHPEVSPTLANSLIRIMSDLSYRQLEIISVLGLLTVFEDSCGPLRKDERPATINGLDNIGLAVDIYDLHNRGLVHSSELITSIVNIVPSALSINGLGMLLYQLAELMRMKKDDQLDDIMRYFTGEQYEAMIVKCYPHLDENR